MKIKKLKKIPVIVIIIIIFILSSRTQKLPDVWGAEVYDYFYMFLHIGEFGLFTMLLMLGFYPQVKLYFLVGISLLYSVLDEVYQYFVPTRYFDKLDILCNVIGVILGVVFYLVIYRIYRKRVKGK